MFLFFFFQAEDGIRDLTVTGVQTCALPILRPEPQYVPGPWPSRAAQMVNDLEGPIARRHPEIDQMKATLRRAGALAAAMTGSGSTVFGLFQRRRDAVGAVE